VRALAPTFRPYEWAPSTADLAEAAGLDPSRSSASTETWPPHRRARHGRGRSRLRSPACTRTPRRLSDLVAAIARYAEVEPENVVLGAGADDLILLCARAFAGPGDVVAVPPRPTYSLFAVAAALTGALLGEGEEAAVTFACRPNNPTGSLDPLPEERPLVVDEAYFEYCGETATPLLDDGVVVIRTFSKAFGLAGARVGYALADAETAAELNARQAPRRSRRFRRRSR
jgi:histidinol-phosphate aminotransferase